MIVLICQVLLVAIAVYDGVQDYRRDRAVREGAGSLGLAPEGVKAEQKSK